MNSTARGRTTLLAFSKGTAMLIREWKITPKEIEALLSIEAESDELIRFQVELDIAWQKKQGVFRPLPPGRWKGLEEFTRTEPIMTPDEVAEAISRVAEQERVNTGTKRSRLKNWSDYSYKKEEENND